jgi:2-C-methyl-D-erythritol 4-phosphate cytidylyltransferase
MSVSTFLFNKKHYTTAIILAGGSGTRMGCDNTKQFIDLAGVPVIARAIEAFQRCDMISEIVIVAKKEEIPLYQDLIEKYGFDKVERVVEGGNTRQSSALKGFEAASDKTKFIAIHDGARPLVTVDIIERTLSNAYLSHACIAAVACKDTPKTINPISKKIEPREKQTEREKLVLAQTPQAFYADLYRCAAYYAREKGFEATDDASLAEFSGFEVKCVEGSYENIKITTPEDLIFAEAILSSRYDKS